MKPADPILVLGASGNTGGEVASLLRVGGQAVRTGARREIEGSADHLRFDWAEPSTHDAAVAGVRRLYLVAPVGVAEPVELVAPFVEKALAAGVERFVFLSSSAVAPGEPGLGRVDALLRSSAPQWATLRPSWFMQNFVGEHPLAEAIRSRSEIVSATGDGQLGFVDARDIAACAAALLTQDRFESGEHLITGPEALSYGQVAALVAEISDRPVRFTDISVAALVDRYVAGGLPRSFAEGLAALDDRIRNGEQAGLSDAVAKLTGVAPRSMRDFLVEFREKLG